MCDEVFSAIHKKLKSIPKELSLLLYNNYYERISNIYELLPRIYLQVLKYRTIDCLSPLHQILENIDYRKH